jgi:hypothetical protein
LHNPSLLGLLLVSLLVGCERRPQSAESDPAGSSGTHLKESEVGRIAAKTAQEHGYRLADFQKPSVRYDVKDGGWSFFYVGKVLTVGNDFIVWVDDRTGKAELFRGL